MPDERIELTREQLYELVWSEPMTSVASQLGLSDRGLGKMCQRLNVLRPGRGYWQLKEAGMRVHRPPQSAVIRQEHV